MVKLKTSQVLAQTKVQNTDVLSITLPLINRMKLEDKSDKTITSYARSVERLVRFHGMLHFREMEIDEVLDFLVYCKEERQINWRTNKMYVAGLRYYWTHLLEDDEFASKIPYPKEHPSLPKILSREELAQLFASCNNDKHRVMFRLIYSAGLRRSELIHLKMHDIETQDGKMRIRINKGKGKKDRYTVLSKTVLEELYMARKSLNAIQPAEKVKLDSRAFILMTSGKDICRCPRCGKGEMIIFDILLPAIRGSPKSKLLRQIPKYRKMRLQGVTNN